MSISLFVFQQRQTQQTKDDNVVYLNTIQSQLEGGKKRKQKTNPRHFFFS